jgi:iron complex transport system permease protein
MLVPLTAVLGAAIATAVVVVTAQRSSGPSTATVVLAGIAINALTGAGIGLLAHVADDARLRDMTVWMLGSVGQVGQGALPWMVVPAALAGLWLWRESAGLDALLLGESEAWHLGVDVQRLQQRVIAACALGVGASVAFTGPIGFVGLVAPHVLRSAVGPAHALLMPAAAAGGAALLLASDLIARTVVAPTELPIGVVTGLLGGPFFFALLLRGVTKGELG